MDSSMGRSIQLANLEHDQKFDADLVKQIAKIIEALSNLEDWLPPYHLLFGQILLGKQ